MLEEGNGDVLKAFDFEVVEKRERGRPKMTWKRQAVRRVREIGLRKEDAIDKPKWCNAADKLSKITRWIRPPPLTGSQQDLKRRIFLRSA